MSKHGQLPRAARLYIFTVVAAGSVILALRLPAALRWGPRELLGAAALMAAIVITELFPLRLVHGTEGQNFSLTDAPWAAALLLAPASVLTFAVVVGVVVAHLLRRIAPIKVAFNAGQFVVGLTAAQLVYGLFAASSPTEPAAWLAAVAGMAAYFLLNVSAIAMVIALVQRERFLRALMPLFGFNLLQWVGNVAIGMLAAVIWSVKPIALPLLAVPLVLAYFAYRAWIEGIRERDRMAGLYEASRALLGPLDQEEDFRPLLVPVRRMLKAAAVELVLAHDGQLRVYDTDGTATTRAVADAGSTEAYVRVRGGVAPSIAMIGGVEDARGVLAVYREQPLTEAEQSLLDALASQVAVRLQNLRLFVETVEQRTELSEIIGNTSDGISTVSRDGVITSWNEAMERITGFDRDEATGRPWKDVLGSAPSGDQLWSSPRGDQTAPAARDTQIVRKDRVPRWIRYTVNPIFDRDAQRKANVVVVRDVTAELETEQLKSDFVATVSHELRTPLTPLKGFLAALLQGTVEDSAEARREYYRIMLNQASRLERLITDLLEVSRIESGKPLVDNQATELTSVVAEQVHEFAQHEPRRALDLRGAGTPILASADPFRLGQVVSNLLSNAMKYSPDGSPVEVTLATRGGEAIVSVRDHGDGIPLAEQERVFERFQRLENGLTRQTGGTGLGLYIARRLVEAMSGRLWVESTPGSGSTFSFSLPLLHTAPRANGHDSARDGSATVAAAATR